MVPHACRFVPTCSEYALEAVQRHGTLHGTGLAIARLLRCHPFSHAGYDPVPPVTYAVKHCCHQAGSAPFGVTREPISRDY